MFKKLGLLTLVLASNISFAQQFDVQSNYFFEEKYNDLRRYQIEEMMASKTKQIWPGIDVASKTKQIWPGISPNVVASKTKQIWPGIGTDVSSKTKQIWPGIGADVSSKTKQIWPGIEALKKQIDDNFTVISNSQKAAIFSMMLIDMGISLEDLEEVNSELTNY